MPLAQLSVKVLRVFTQEVSQLHRRGGCSILHCGSWLDRCGKVDIFKGLNSGRNDERIGVVNSKGLDERKYCG